MSEQWNPINDLMVLQDQMNRLFEDVSQRRARAEAKPQDDIERADWIPAADVYEQENEYVIALDLPGADRSAPRKKRHGGRTSDFSLRIRKGQPADRPGPESGSVFCDRETAMIEDALEPRLFQSLSRGGALRAARQRSTSAGRNQERSTPATTRRPTAIRNAIPIPRQESAVTALNR